MNNINPKEVINIEAVYSRFRMRMRIAAISLLMVFFSQQVSWACAGNLSLLVNLPPSPLIYQDHGEFNRLVAKRVYSLVKPSFRDKAQELKSAYQWLKTPSTQTVPCSAYVLYNLLQANGIKPKIEDISASLISLDLKAGNLKPPFTASRIDNSLYALAKTAENQGLHLYPARLNSITPELLNFLNSQTPFIAHLNYSEALDKGHFVLVTGIEADKVHFFYDKGDTFLPLEKFLEEFSGYCLLSLASVGDSLPVVSDAEAQGVLGAKSYKGVKVDYTKLFKEPSTTDLLIGFGVSMGAMFGGSMLGGMMKGQGLSFGKAFAGLGAGIAQAEISKASVNFSVQQFKMKPEYAQIVGYGVSGAMTGAMAGIGNNGQFKIGNGENFWNNHSIMRGAIMGSVQGGMQGGSSVLAYQGIKNTSFYKDNPFIARQAAGLLGSAVGYMGFYAMTGAMRMNVNIDKSLKDGETGNVTRWDGTHMNRVNVESPGVWNNLKLALADSSFLSSMISQGTALGVEWAAGPKYAKYSRLLGQGIGSAAGGLATGNGISPWKMMMNGALSGGISLGLGYLGGEVGPDGKNKLGLTDIQMAGVEWLATGLMYSSVTAFKDTNGERGTTFGTAFAQRFSEFSTDYVSFGRTSPLYTKGAGGWSSFMYNQKIADFGGFANYKANADYSMKLQGYKSWSKFVDDGKAANLLPSFSNSLVRYASSSLHYGSVENSIATLEHLPESVTHYLGLGHQVVENDKSTSLTTIGSIGWRTREEMQSPTTVDTYSLAYGGTKKVLLYNTKGKDNQTVSLSLGTDRPLKDITIIPDNEGGLTLHSSEKKLKELKEISALISSTKDFSVRTKGAGKDKEYEVKTYSRSINGKEETEWRVSTDKYISSAFLKDKKVSTGDPVVIYSSENSLSEIVDEHGKTYNKIAPALEPAKASLPAGASAGNGSKVEIHSTPNPATTNVTGGQNVPQGEEKKMPSGEEAVKKETVRVPMVADINVAGDAEGAVAYGKVKVKTTYPNFDTIDKIVTTYDESGKVIGKQVWEGDKLVEFSVDNGYKVQTLLPGDKAKGETYGTYNLKKEYGANKEGTEKARIYESTNGRQTTGRIYNSDGLVVNELPGRPQLKAPATPTPTPTSTTVVSPSPEPTQTIVPAASPSLTPVPTPSPVTSAATSSPTLTPVASPTPEPTSGAVGEDYLNDIIYKKELAKTLDSIEIDNGDKVIKYNVGDDYYMSIPRRKTKIAKIIDTGMGEKIIIAKDDSGRIGYIDKIRIVIHDGKEMFSSKERETFWQDRSSMHYKPDYRNVEYFRGGNDGPYDQWSEEYKR